jgi:hypothetical protein
MNRTQMISQPTFQESLFGVLGEWSIDLASADRSPRVSLPSPRSVRVKIELPLPRPQPPRAVSRELAWPIDEEPERWDGMS